MIGRDAGADFYANMAIGSTIRGQLDNTNSNTTSNLAKKEQKVIWSGVNQQFFKHRPNNERDLYVSASIFSIPHQRLGDGILPGYIFYNSKIEPPYKPIIYFPGSNAIHLTNTEIMRIVSLL